jgi:hypothetical protein
VQAPAFTQFQSAEAGTRQSDGGGAKTSGTGTHHYGNGKLKKEPVHSR